MRGAKDLQLDSTNQIIIYRSLLSLLRVEFVDLDIVSPPSGQLLIANGIDMKLLVGHQFGLGHVGSLHVNDTDLARVKLSHKINPTQDGHPLAEIDLDWLLGKLEISQVHLALPQILPDYIAR
jgi:hypothetical protein